MEIKQSDLDSLDLIAHKLRVPELRYHDDTLDPQAGKETKFLDDIRLKPANCNGQSIVKRIKDEFDSLPSSIRFNNFAFFVDRLFDVWVRKSRLSTELTEVLSNWRFPYYLSLLNDNSLNLHTCWARLIEAIASSSTSWSGENERSKKVLIDLLTEIEYALYAAKPLNETTFHTILARWETHLSQHEKRRSKVIERLIESEHVHAKNTYFRALAVSEINALFSGRFVSESLQHFLSDQWVSILSVALAQAEESQWDELRSLNKQIALVFCKKGEAAFKYAPNLIDELSSLAVKYKVVVDDALWSSLDQDVVSLLQNIPLTEKAFIVVPCRYSLDELSVKLDVAVGQSIQINEDGAEVRGLIASYYADCGQILLVNHLGIKIKLLTVAAFKDKLRLKELEYISPEARFSDVILSTLSGLSRIVDNQAVARKRAAEKAIKEAEVLKAEQLRVEQQAKQRVLEMEQQAALAEAERQEGILLEARKIAVEAIHALKLGAWITVKQGGELKRFKLAVKFAATGRYIFVDRIGVHKKEFKEDELVDQVVSKDIEILDDGADFEDSLERVVSRIRMGK